MNYSSNERGALPILVALLVVALVAVVGFAVYNFSRSNQKAAQTVNASPSPTGSPAASATPTPSPTGKVFTVKELGIQFTITDDIKDLVYSVSVGGDGKSAAFSTASLVAAGGKYCAADKDAPLGAVSIDSAANAPGGSGKVKQLGSQYLYFTPPQAPCSDSASFQNLSSKQRASFQTALDSAQLVQ